MTISNKLYHSKLLLFGEYTVTLGSGALATPLPFYSGQWNIPFSNQTISDSLLSVVEYFENNQKLSLIYDLDSLKSAVIQGMIFKSSIPVGYGLGSSGALVAALYDSFVLKKTDDIYQLKQILAETENAFHGNSSGIDPLVSYLDMPVIIESGGTITSLNKDLFLSGFFLVDTYRSRKTEPLVQWFKNEISVNPSFKSAVNILASVNQKAIQSVVDNNQASLKDHIKDISVLQYDLFNVLIPKDIQPLWLNGLNSEKYYLKLCGAGGGGMMLGYSLDHSYVLNNFTNHNITFIKG